MFPRRLQYLVATAFGWRMRRPARRRWTPPYRPVLELLETRRLLSGVVSISATASAREITYGEPVTLTVRVTGSDGPPTGTIAFSDRGFIPGIFSLNIADGVGEVSHTTSSLPVGDHDIWVFYRGDSQYRPSQAELGGVNVAPRSTSLSMTVVPNTAGWSPYPIVGAAAEVKEPAAPVYVNVGETVAFVTKVSTRDPGFLPYRVTYMDGSTVLGTAGDLPLAGVPAIFQTNQLSVGTHTITAVYNWNNTPGPASSQATATVIVTSEPIATLSASNVTAMVGEPVTLTVAYTGLGPLPAGNVTFLDGATWLGEATLSVVDGVAQASFTSSSLVGGAHSITAIYDGDGTTPRWSATSASVIVHSPLTLSGYNIGGSFGYMLRVTAFTGAEDVSGSVTVFDGETDLGTFPYHSFGVLEIGPLAPGAHILTAVYRQTPDGPVIGQASMPVWLFLPGRGITATGSDPGAGAQVNIYDGQTEELLISFAPFDREFSGGVRTAIGDVNSDGTPDIIAVAGPTGGPNVIIFNGKNGLPLYNFMAFDPGFTGGVTVAAGDVNGDGFDDIIAGADAGGGPNVAIYSGSDGALLASFYAFDPAFTGGVSVTAGNVLGTGEINIVVGAGPGGGPNVAIFTDDGTLLASFYAYEPTLTAGVVVSAASQDGSDQEGIFAVTLNASSAPAMFNFTPVQLGVVVPLPPLSFQNYLSNSAEESDSVEQLDAFFAADPLLMGSLFVIGAN